MRLGLAAFALSAPPAAAAPGYPDAGFGTGGLATVTLTSGPESAGATAISVAPGGGATVAAGLSLGGARLVRFTATGGLDSGFGGDGIVEADARLGTLARQAGGSIVAITQAGALRRFTASGNADAAFPTLATLPGPARDLAIAPDDAVYVAGAGWIARLTPTGSFDSGFATAGVATLPAAIDARALALLPQSSGHPKILVGGSSGSKAALLRLAADGTADAGFHGGAARVWSFNALACAVIGDVVAAPAGAIVLSGGYSYGPSGGDPSYLDGFVAATDADGVVKFGGLTEAPVTDCASNGAKGDSPSIAVNDQGKVHAVVGDEFGDYAERRRSDGTSDQYSSPELRSESRHALGVDAAGRAYVAGADPASLQRVAIERFLGGENQLPTITASVDPPSVGLGHTFTVTANPHDPDGSVRTVEFDLNQDGITDVFRFNPGPWTTPPHGYGRSGRYPIGIRVSDDLGGVAEAVAYVDVVGPPSLPQAAILLGFGSPAMAKRPLTFLSNSTDDGTITLAWDFDGDGYDDGTTSPITYTFPTAGPKTVRLEVTDNDGNKAQASASFDLLDPDAGGALFTVPPAIGGFGPGAAKPGPAAATLRLTVGPRVSVGAATARVECRAASVCAGHVAIARQDARRLTGSSVFGRARYRVAPGSARSLRVKLSASAQRRLRRDHRLRAAAFAFDATGSIVARVERVTLRRR